MSRKLKIRFTILTAEIYRKTADGVKPDGVRVWTDNTSEIDFLKHIRKTEPSAIVANVQKVRPLFALDVAAALSGGVLAPTDENTDGEPAESAE